MGPGLVVCKALMDESTTVEGVQRPGLQREGKERWMDTSTTLRETQQ